MQKSAVGSRNSLSHCFAIEALDSPFLPHFLRARIVRFRIVRFRKTPTKMGGRESAEWLGLRLSFDVDRSVMSRQIPLAHPL